jgi:hypothetical protein
LLHAVSVDHLHEFADEGKAAWKGDG